MLLQLSQKGLINVLILDGGSTYSPMVSLLKGEGLRGKVRILSENPGPRFFAEDFNFYQELPEVFCVTDPDLEFNSALPENFIQILFDLTEEYKVGKAGFALNISEELEFKSDAFAFAGAFRDIREWESVYWSNKIGSKDGSDYYLTELDTTFAIYNKAYFQPENFLAGIRISGNFTAIHIPWLKNDPRPQDEIENYNRLNKHGTWNALDPLHIKLQEEINRLRMEISQMRVLQRILSLPGIKPVLSLMLWSRRKIARIVK
jgi:hypothetical protein